MTLAANRIVAGEGVMAWGVASLPVVLPGLAAIGAGLLIPAWVACAGAAQAGTRAARGAGVGSVSLLLRRELCPTSPK